jgi:hypothetical protein
MQLRDTAAPQRALSKQGPERNERLIDAYAWLNVAASLGHPDAVSRRALLAAQLSEGDIVAAQSKSIEFAPR